MSVTSKSKDGLVHVMKFHSRGTEIVYDAAGQGRMAHYYARICDFSGPRLEFGRLREGDATCPQCLSLIMKTGETSDGLVHRVALTNFVENKIPSYSVICLSSRAQTRVAISSSKQITCLTCLSLDAEFLHLALGSA